MELFPAADQQQLEFIKRVIDDCDYYLLIIAGRYGSVSETGLSYTEQEYDYAVGRGLKVIAFVHENPDDIPLGKSEKDPASQEKLRKFREKVCTGRLVKPWKDASQLPALVALSLVQTIKMSPATGWVRADKVANVEVLSEINELRKRNDELQMQVSKYRQALVDLTSPPVFKDLAGLDEETELGGRYWKKSYSSYRGWSVTTTWRRIFAHVAPYLVTHPAADTIKAVLLSALLFDEKGMDRGDSTNEELDDQDFQTVGVQLSALGLVKIEYSKSTAGGYGLFRSFTAAGEKLMLELRTVRTKMPAAGEQLKK
ncbi:conserved hypothetical protein [Candidatus Sulfotelmatobacter kueseliae]|uniref:DUF4062 domain-containing protein n=1 Tax=Candidatus Sulfotelmatobacter kueseliae TaxID=2042962 RepID=A0A2U3K5E6_9BACT|nr:conserved hypothetical protein [Candidatus Sulfotelmatobacter kueseliae]